ncbi:MAG: hypothetical protein IJE74_08920 [Clostridia bacterium]|nr:hypothetical protein [Clostridia bacterium]
MIKTKLFRAYIITAIVCLCITSCVSAIFVADENAKKITLGEENTVLVLSSTDEKYYSDPVNPIPVIEKLAQGAKKAASIAPPPISNIYWFIVNTRKTDC